MRETLEQRAQRFQAEYFQKPWDNIGVVRDLAVPPLLAAFARVLLEEAAQIAYAMKDYDKSNTAYAIGDRIRELMK